MAGIVVEKISENLKILGQSERFIFGLSESPEPLGAFKLDNIFTPAAGVPSVTNFETRNKDLSGFRWVHTTNAGETFGSYKLQSFVNAQSTGTDILLFNHDGTITFNQSVNLSGFAITGDLDMNNHKIVNLTDPVNAQDAATKSFVETLVGSGTITLSGAVSGTGQVGTDITTTLNTVAIDKLAGYPADGGLFLRGDGEWSNNFAKIGINFDPTEDGVIQFANGTKDAKIILNKDAPSNPWDMSAIGYLSTWGTLYHTPIGKSHLFFTGANGNLGLEITPLTLKVGYGISSVDFRKLVFYEGIVDSNPNQTYAIGVELDGTPNNHRNVRTQVQTINDAFRWCYGIDANTSGEWMRLSNAGLNLYNKKLFNLLDPVDPQDAATKNYVINYVQDAIDSSFGPIVSLPFGDLTFNWAYASSVNPSPYQLINNLSDSQESKNFKYRVLTNDIGTREWNHEYTLIGNSDLNGIYKINYNAVSSSFTPLSIAIYPFATSQNLMSIAIPVDMGGFEIRNAANPTAAQSLTTRSYVDNKTWTTSQITDYTTATNALISAATIATSKLSGFPNTTTTYLRGDGTWANFASAATSAAITLRLDQFALPTASVNLNNQKIINLLPPTLATDAVTKGYADALAANLPALINVTGASQTFLYSSNYNSSFIAKNDTIPTSGNDSTIDLRLLNSTNGGYRLKHTLTSGGIFGGLGSLSLDALSSFGDVTNFINFGFSSLFAGVGFAGGVPNTTFGTATSDTIVATLSVNGGPQNVTNESSCFRVVSSDNSTKIELKNTSASGRLYELRSNSDGTFDIVDRTSTASRFKLGTTGAITTGVWNGSIISSQYGGTGVNNGGRTLSYGGNVSIGGTFTTNSNFSVNGSFTVNQNFSTNQPFSTNGAVTMQGPFTTSGTITLRTLTLGGSADVTLPISGTLATLSNTLNQFGLPTADLNVNSFKLTNVATPTLGTDGANKAYVDSVVTTFGPNVPLNFSGLNFNWTYASSTNPTPYQFTNTFTDSQISKNFKYRVLTNDVLTREWNHDYTLIGNSDVNGIYKINYVGGGQTFTPINIVVYPFATSQNLMTIGVPINMGGFEIRNALNPTTPQSLATKSYVDATVGGSSVTLTGAVTGSGSGTINTVLNPTVNVNAASYAFNLNNANSAGVTEFQISYGIPYLKFGVNTAGSGNYIDNIFDPFVIRMGGVDRFIFSSVGNLGIGGSGPTQAKLVVNGGVQNVTGEETAIRAISSLNNVKIELQSTAVGGKLYELRSSSTGAFDITDRTGSATRFVITTAGNIGIGTNTPNAALQVANVLTNRRFVLWETNNNDHQYFGFGVNSGVLRYQVDNTTTSHVFYAGTSSTASNELARISGTGTAQFTKIAGYAGTKPNIGNAGSLGTAATFTINGSSSELSGTITIFSGTGGNAAGPLVGVSLINAMPNSNWGVVLFPGNNNATQVTDRIFVVVANNFQFTINARTALANNTTYTWNYIIIGA